MAMRFDPKQLLNPRSRDLPKRRKDEPMGAATAVVAGASQNGMPRYVFDNSHSEAGSESENGSVSMGRLIERRYNVSNREDRPRKKAKKDHESDGADDGKPKAVFSGGGKGGDLGEYMKQKRKESQEERAGTSSVVDLTAGKVYSEFHLLNRLTGFGSR